MRGGVRIPPFPSFGFIESHFDLIQKARGLIDEAAGLAFQHGSARPIDQSTGPQAPPELGCGPPIYGPARLLETPIVDLRKFLSIGKPNLYPVFIIRLPCVVASHLICFHCCIQLEQINQRLVAAYSHKKNCRQIRWV